VPAPSLDDPAPAGGGVPAPRARRSNRGPSAAAENRASLIAAAREVFAATGYDAPLSSVARRAGVGQGSLYRHFPDRVSLALAAFEENVAQLEALAAEPGRTLDDCLSLLTRQAVEAAAFINMLAADHGDDERIASCADRVTAVLAGKLRLAQQAGGYGRHLTPDDLMMALGMVAGLIARVSADKRQATAERAWRLLRRSFAT
jgi:AcrR family transcriptional regulator